jgi:hypothetical protein
MQAAPGQDEINAPALQEELLAHTHRDAELLTEPEFIGHARRVAGLRLHRRDQDPDLGPGDQQLQGL